MCSNHCHFFLFYGNCIIIFPKFWGGGPGKAPPPLYETLLPDPYPSYRQERLRDGYDSTPDPGSSCLRCSTQRQTATWLLYRVLYSLLAAVVSAISLTLAPQCQVSLVGRAGASPPSRTAAIIFLCRTSCPKSSTCFFFSDISICLRRVTRVSFSAVFHYFVYTYVCIIIRICVCHAPRNCMVGHGFSTLNSFAMDLSAIGV